MTQFYVVEVRQLPSGEYDHQVHWAYDESADRARLKADSKYHEILSAAALSNTLSHAAILFSTEGFPLEHMCYKHETVEEPETEPVTVPEEE